MHPTDTLLAASAVSVAHAAAQGQGSGARAQVVADTQLLAAVEAAVADLVNPPVPVRSNLADAFGPAYAARAVARGGKAMVFRADGSSEIQLKALT